MKEEVERIKKLVGIDHNRWEQPCTCDKCKNMCKVPCIGTPKDIEAIIDAGYADRLKETMWMVGYLAVKEKPIAMIQPTEKDGWCAFRQPDGLCELHDLGLKPTEGVLASCKVVEEDDIPTYETSVLRAVAHEWVKVENFGNVMKVVFKFLHENERRNKLNKVVKILKEKGFVVYRKGGKEPGVFYAKEGDSRIGFVYPNNGYIYDRIKMWSFSRVYKPHKKTGSSCLMCVSDEFTIENAIKSIEDRLWVNYIKDGNGKRPEEYKNIREFVGSFTKFYSSVELVEVK